MLETIMIARLFLNLLARYPLRRRDTIWTTLLGMSSRVVWNFVKPIPLMIMLRHGERRPRSLDRRLEGTAQTDLEKFETTPLGIWAAMLVTNNIYVLGSWNACISWYRLNTLFLVPVCAHNNKQNEKRT